MQERGKFTSRQPWIRRIPAWAAIGMLVMSLAPAEGAAAPTPSDTCEDAVLVPYPTSWEQSSPANVNVTGFSTAANDPVLSCPVPVPWSVPQQGYRTAWYKFVNDSSAERAVSMFSNLHNYPNIHAVYSGTCAALTELACAWGTDHFANGAGNDHSGIDFVVPAGETRYVQIAALVNYPGSFTHLFNETIAYGQAVDLVVAPVKPIAMTIRPGQTQATKSVKVKVSNVSAEGTAPVTVYGDGGNGRVVNTTCRLTTQGDDGSAVTPAEMTIAPGKSGTFTFELIAKAAEFSTPNRKSPIRCTVEFYAEAESGVDPTSSNGALSFDVLVLDMNDL